MLIPYNEEDLEGFSVSKLISARGQNTNVPEVLEKYEYEELRSQQKSLF
jgi:hypothetical protein